MVRLLILSTVSALALAHPAFAQVNIPLPKSQAPSGVMTGTPVIVQKPAAGAPSLAAPGATVSLPGAPPVVITPGGTDGRPNINPYDRDIPITAPMTYRDKPLGEVEVLLTHDDRFIIETASFLALIDKLLNEKAKADIKAALAGRDRFESPALADTGVTLDFDPGSLSVVVLRIQPEKRATEPLFATPRADDEPADIQPAKFAAFLNVNAVENHIWGNVANNGFRKPSIYLNGAARYGGIVLESDVQFSEEASLVSSNYRFDRRYARLVYDQPNDFRRWYAGDLTPEIRGQQSYAQMGGLGVSRQRKRFDQFRSAILQGNRQLLLQSDATVDVYRNGSLLKQFQLQAGSYDLSSLPLLAGSNDVQIKVRDATGMIQNVAYRSYLDPIDLQPGDFEYGAYIGKTSDSFGRTPVYNGNVAFSGFFRKAFLNHPAIGVGVQISEYTQIFTGQTQFILSQGSRLQFDMGISNTTGYGAGYAPGVTFERIFDRAGLIDSFVLHADYRSRRFGSLGNRLPDNSSSLSLDAQYSRAMSQYLTVTLGGSYTKSRVATFGDSYRLNAVSTYHFAPKWSVRAGINYTRFGNGLSRADGLAFSISLVFEPSYRDRAEAAYDSINSAASASYSHSSDGRIGSVGYGGLATRDDSQSSAQGYLDYIDSKFDASLIHSAYGSDFGSITDQQVTSLRVGTSLAFADGAFGVGRRINDSFAILYPHKSLKGHAVVAGQSIAENLYLSKSGALGGAVNNYLSSYVTQSVQYDVENPPSGYDIGDGIVRVKPMYHSGYALQVGMDAFASAMGTMKAPDGTPISLKGGYVFAQDGKDKEPIPFFTNSVGRFSIQNLRPGASYRIELVNTPYVYNFTVPVDTKGLVDLKSVVAVDKGAVQ